jgi:thioredoxin-like negative regulator of GroEL
MMSPRGPAATPQYLPSDTAGNAITTVTAETFEKAVLEGPGAAMVEFMSYGCSHCRVFEPIYEEAAAGLAHQVRCFRVNVASEKALADKYRITGTPSIVMFSHSREVGRLEGPAPSLGSFMASVQQSFGL